MRAALVVSLCLACSPPPPSSPPPALIALEVPAVFDMGVVSSPGTGKSQFELRNTGHVDLGPFIVERVGGDPEIEAELFAESTLHPGDTAQVNLRVKPTTTLLKDYRTDFVVRAHRLEPVPFTVIAHGVFVDCQTRPFVDFGSVVVGDTAHETFTVINTSAVTTTASLELVTGSAFTSAGAGAFTLLPGEARDVVLSFTPRSTNEPGSQAKVRTHALCPEKTVQLVGAGVSHVVTCGDLVVDLGWCPPQRTCASQLQVLNHSFAPVQLSELTVGPTGEVRLGADAGTTLPAGRHGTTPDAPSREPGVLTLLLELTPAMESERALSFTAKTSNPSQPTVRCELTVWGGGPIIEVTPPLLDFGTLTGHATLPFTVRNVGTLEIGRAVILKLVVQRLAVTALTPAATLGQIAGGFGNGLGPPLEPGEAIELPVTVLPGDAGSLMEWQIDVFTNDIHASDAGLRVRALQ